MKRKGIVALAVGTLCVALVAVFGVFAVGRGLANEDEPLLQYPDFAPTPTVPQKPGDTAAVASRAYTDSFDSESVDNYEVVDLSNDPFGTTPVWTVQNGALFQDFTSPLGDPEEMETLAVIRASSGSDYTVSAKVYDEGNATFGLIVRRNGDSFYRFSMIGNEYEATPKVRLEKVVGDTVTRLAEVDGPGYDMYTWYTIDFSVNGSTLEASINGKPVLSATDSELTRGQAGLYTRAFGKIRFDDVVVSQAQ